jgi:hypothetical protein
MTQERAKTRKKTRMDFKWIQELWRFHALWRRLERDRLGSRSPEFVIRSALIRGNPRQSAF